MKVLIIDDIAGLREHAARVARTTLQVYEPEIIQCSSGLQGVKLAKSHYPDLVIMDISMPDISGIKAAQMIWAHCPQRKILFWSQYQRECYVRELGRIVPDQAIHGYALKSEPDQKLAYAIESIVVKNNPYIDPIVRGVQARMQCRDKSLTDVEYETLLDIAQGLTDRAIARRRNISVRGVQQRLSMLMNKLIKGEDAHLRESAGMEILNVRTRVVFEGLIRGLIDPDEIRAMNTGLDDWLCDEFAYSAQEEIAIQPEPDEFFHPPVMRPQAAPCAL